MMRIVYTSILIGLSILFTQCVGQVSSAKNKLNILLESTNGRVYYDRALALSTSGDAYQFMSLRGDLGANNALLKKEKDNSVIDYQMTLIENILNKSRFSKEIKNNRSPYKDHYRGWVSHRDNGTKDIEVPLYESYSFFYITQFLHYTKSNGWYNRSSSNQQRWNNVLAFVEKDIWTKWHERSRPVKGNHYWYFLRARTHMGSHWAGIAMYLNALTQNKEIKKQTKLLVNQYDTLLRRNLKVKGKGYIWNATYDNVEGTYASKVPENIIQDVSHGNHVVAYVIAAYEFGNSNWTREDISRFSYTLTEFVYDKKNNLFNDNVDGTVNERRPGWGNFVGDGWIQLAHYDDNVYSVMMKFKQANLLRKYGQELQFKANLNSR